MSEYRSGGTVTHPGWGDKWAGAPQLTADPERATGAEPEASDEGFTRPPSGGEWVRPPRERVPFWTARRRKALRAVSWFLVVTVVVLGLLVGWVVIDALRARTALAAAADGVASLRSEALAGKTDGLDRQVAQLQRDAAEARAATHGPHWSVVTELPAVGPTATALATMTEVVDELARGALPDLARSARLADPASFTPHDGRVDLEPLRQVAPDVVRADASVQVAVQRVDQLDGLLLPQVEDAVEQFAAQLAQLRSTTATAARAAEVLPTMLGAQGPRDYLVLVQNPAEPRALGGIPGTVLVLHAEDGQVTLTDQMPGGMMGPYDEPVLPLTADERAVLGTRGDLGRWMQNVTTTPDFPRAAQLAREMWRRQTGQEVDGVLTTDPVVLATMLRGGGPVEVTDGVLVDPADLDDYLLNGVYLEHEDPRTQDEIFARVAERAFDRLASGEDGGEGRMITALATAAEQGRLLVWSTDDGVNQRLAGTVLDGTLRGKRGDSPVVGVFTQGINMAKIAYYLDTAVRVRTTQERPDGSRELEVTVTYTSTVPERQISRMPEWIIGRDEDDPGEIRIRSLIYAPSGGWIIGAKNGAQEIGLSPKKQGELSVSSRDIELSPGATASVTYVMITGKRQSGDVILRVTPGPRPVDITNSDADPGKAESE